MDEMMDTLDLDPETCRVLQRTLAERQNAWPPVEPGIAHQLLTGVVGPLKGDSSAYSDDDVIHAAYWCAVIYRHSRADGMLKGRPAYEARELLGHRANAAANRASDLHGWGLLLARGVGLPETRLSPVIRQWWRQVTTASASGTVVSDVVFRADDAESKAAAAAAWRRVKTSLPDVLLAAELLSPWLYQIRSSIKKVKK